MNKSNNLSIQHEVISHKRKKHWKEKHHYVWHNLKALGSFFRNGLQFRNIIGGLLVRYNKCWGHLAPVVHVLQFLCHQTHNEYLTKSNLNVEK
ncbi:hypothetical protein GBA52_012523 [Prunus armeniaca]|nr:hypothetical protein GBA52_012523 [Prunus armeniaca]